MKRFNSQEIKKFVDAWAGSIENFASVDQGIEFKANVGVWLPDISVHDTALVMLDPTELSVRIVTTGTIDQAMLDLRFNDTPDTNFVFDADYDTLVIEGSAGHGGKEYTVRIHPLRDDNAPNQ